MRLRKIIKEELNKVLKLHKNWLKKGKKEGECVISNFSNTDLSKVEPVKLSNANLSGVDDWRK